jgi:UDP-N-acetylglucosamine/UDP-N-acetylgalactosamine diphosphorylase
MTSTMDSRNAPATAEALRQAFENAGQGQVFRFWEKISDADKKNLACQAREIDLEEVENLVRVHIRGEQPETIDFSTLEPAPFLGLPVSDEDRRKWADARERGEAALRGGKVAAFTVAGGQGTRLGYDGPKGTFRVTPVREKPLFQVFAEKILAARRRFGAAIPWLIMTSHANHEQTERFFRENGFFGLPEEDVRFFRQGRMPAVDLEGRILLEDRGSIALSPDGHGGSLRALCRSGAIGEMEKRGVEVISYFQVDNPLVQAIDPVFIGFHLAADSEMSSKMIPKAYPEEKVGVFTCHEGRTMVVEYSDLPDELAQQRDPDGELRFRSGSIAIHILSTAFVRKVGEGAAEGGALLPFHRADKKIATVDESGAPVKPEKPNGVKFEMFVFDALPFARNPVILETRREDEFSPVKNAEGVDSPATCVRDQLRQFSRWAQAAGVEIETDAEGVPAFRFEVSPLFGVDAPSFAGSWQKLPEKPELGEGVGLE